MGVGRKWKHVKLIWKMVWGFLERKKKVKNRPGLITPTIECMSCKREDSSLSFTIM